MIAEAKPARSIWGHPVVRGILLAVAVYGFLVSVKLMGGAF